MRNCPRDRGFFLAWAALILVILFLRLESHTTGKVNLLEMRTKSFFFFFHFSGSRGVFFFWKENIRSLSRFD